MKGKLMGDNTRITVGGVVFKSNQIKSSNVKYIDGEKTNCVLLQNGTKLNFPDQRTKEQSVMVIYGVDMSTGKMGTEFQNIDKLEIIGTQEKDYYYLSDCDDYSVQTNNDNGISDDIKIAYDENKNNGVVFADKEDNVSFRDRSKHGVITMNEGWFKPIDE